MINTKKTIVVEFRNVPANERDPMYNTIHFRFDAYNVLSGEFNSVSNLYAISAVYTDPVFDLMNGVVNVDVGMAFCNGDNFSRSLGATRAFNNLKNRNMTRYMRLALRVDPDAQPGMKAHVIASDWYEKLQKPEGRREVHAKIRSCIERVIASSLLPHKFRHALRDGLIRPKMSLSKAVQDVLEGLDSLQCQGRKGVVTRK